MANPKVTSRIILAALSVALGAGFGAGCGGSSTGGSGGAGAGNAGNGAAAGEGGTSQGGSSSTTGGAANGGAASGGAGNAGAAGSGGASLTSADVACDVPSDCVLVPSGCCDTCGEPTAADRLAVNRNRVDQVTQAVCPEPQPCPKCASFPRPALVATCEDKRCAVVDLSLEPLTECATAADCRLRTNACCECGGPTDPGHLMAVGQQGSIEDIVCDPGYACDECLPTFPERTAALCEEGRCFVWYSLK
ncbi:MAG: hypothetical protein H6718_00810 [Polyangiaceae bacterium]|nr:hypothetical protein [Polyangiaceae bacterium]MCB9607840.1 hypothetical protein [Polyangiaceae bacterium]